MLHIGSDPRRLPLPVLADELAETTDSIRATALLREMRRRGKDRAAGARFVIWATGREVVVMSKALLAQAAGDVTFPPPAA